MAIELNPYIEQLSWAEARELILPVNPDFVRHADELELPKECCIFKVRYRYGDYLVKDGELMLRSNSGQNISINNEELPSILKEKLTYAPCVPMGINLNRNIEVFYKSLDGRIIPMVFQKLGGVFALTALLSDSNLVMDQGSFWNLTAGVRSIYSIPKISLTLNHKKIARELGLSLEPPKSMQDQWEFFREIFQSEKHESNWELEVIYFSEEWSKLESGTSWLKFNHFLRKSVWNNAVFFRYLYQASYIMSQATSVANIRCTPNIVSTLKHILYLAGSFLPGLSLNGNELAYPREILCYLYKEVYGLEYRPQFMSLAYFDPKVENSIYYALSLPTQLEFYPENTPHKSKFDELRDLAYSLRKIKDLFTTNTLGIGDLQHSIFRGIKSAEIQCYHSLAEDEQHIKKTSQLFEAGSDSKKACHASMISRGLVGIHKK